MNSSCPTCTTTSEASSCDAAGRVRKTVQRLCPGCQRRPRARTDQPAARQRSESRVPRPSITFGLANASGEPRGVDVAELRPLGQVQQQIGVLDGDDRIIDVVEFGVQFAGVVEGLGIGNGDHGAKSVEPLGDDEGRLQPETDGIHDSPAPQTVIRLLVGSPSYCFSARASPGHCLSSAKI
jgi:hypothetical protein